MAQIILDMGSGNTCKNSVAYAKRMIDCVAAIDNHKHEVILKWQLEEKDPPGQMRLKHEVFDAAYQHAKEKGYRTTSSVFDLSSLEFLLRYDVPFIKIACNPDLYWLADKIHALSNKRIYISMVYSEPSDVRLLPRDVVLRCVPKYPAKIEDYRIPLKWNRLNISDHTPALELWRMTKPAIIEKHFILERADDNPDSGPFAIDPKQFQEMIQ